MRNHFTQAAFSDNEMDCFGDFDVNHTLCKSYCSMRLNCIVERNYSLRLEIIEEMNDLHLHTRKPQ